MAEAVLSLVMKKQKNIDAFARVIGDDKRVLYQAWADLNSGKKSTEVYSTLIAKKTGFDHPCFDEIQGKIADEESFIETPFELTEGVVACGKCGSTKCYVFTKQTRSADESSTTFYFCSVCKNKGSYSGR
jgi:DNA-directed RNA polymerase subunit M/transcription elongation factor TFIIS